MYKKDYHPDADLIFKTKNYGFDSPKSVPFEPLSNALIQIDAALKKEETERTAEDIRINSRIDKEIADRENADTATNDRFLARQVSGIVISGNYGGCFGVLCVAQKIDNVIALTCSGNMYGTFDLPLSKFIGDYSLIDAYGYNGSNICIIPKIAGINGRVTAYAGSSAIAINAGMDNTTNTSEAIPLSFTLLLAIKP